MVEQVFDGRDELIVGDTQSASICRGYNPVHTRIEVDDTVNPIIIKQENGELLSLGFRRYTPKMFIKTFFRRE